ncbi:MAG: hypothetical protein ACI9TV_002911 [Sulfurimonas sp.]|jgi:hypothetical protein|uniref:hypothetical protein n=1 Tax=Sulfurimonas sp. TaxID=2022749 RepID=UPI0039E3A754
MNVVYLSANEYRYIETVKLSKDEHKKFLVKYDKSEKLFKFRWTLYSNSTLVILRSYDRIVAQHVLYAKQNRRSIRVDLKPKGQGFNNLPYVLIKFIEYDFSIDKAIFKLFLSDKGSQVSLEHLEDK